MVNKTTKILSADDIRKMEIDNLIKTQDGILGIPLEGGPKLTSFIFAGWFYRGNPLLICGTDKIITLPDVFDTDPTDLVCDVYGEERKVMKYYIDLSYRVQVTTTQNISLNELHPNSTKKTCSCSGDDVSTQDIIGDIERALRELGQFIEQSIRECNANPRCVFDKVWAKLVRQLCGSDCSRDCSFDCEWYDVGCHGRKLDCERLKAQCKICEGAMGIGKEFVKGWLCINYNICITQSNN